MTRPMDDENVPDTLVARRQRGDAFGRETHGNASELPRGEHVRRLTLAFSICGPVSDTHSSGLVYSGIVRMILALRLFHRRLYQEVLALTILVRKARIVSSSERRPQPRLSREVVNRT